MTLSEGRDAMALRERFLIAQISDLHFGSNRYDASLARYCLAHLETARPDIALVAGDLTDMGYPEEFEQARAFLDQLPCPYYVVPGNHDERNVGWRTYERLFGSRWGRHEVHLGIDCHARGCERLVLAACDSSEPDLDAGELGRVRHRWLAETFEGRDDAFKIAMLHHHLVAVPNTGRERNTVSDAGDVLALLAEQRVDLVVAGHRHVPHWWVINGVPIVMSGTATTWRIRAEIPPSFNLIAITHSSIVVTTVTTNGAGESTVTIPFQHASIATAGALL